MPVLDTLRKSLLGSGSKPGTFLCESCGSDFSMVDTRNVVDLECPFCGSTEVRARG